MGAVHPLAEGGLRIREHRLRRKIAVAHWDSPNRLRLVGVSPVEVGSFADVEDCLVARLKPLEQTSRASAMSWSVMTQFLPILRAGKVPLRTLSRTHRSDGALIFSATTPREWVRGGPGTTQLRSRTIRARGLSLGTSLPMRQVLKVTLADHEKT